MQFESMHVSGCVDRTNAYKICSRRCTCRKVARSSVSHSPSRPALLLYATKRISSDCSMHALLQGIVCPVCVCIRTYVPV